MGVAGLWDVLRPAGLVRSLTHLAVVDGFEKNTNGHRGFRIGIDASIWFYHAAYGREGENPELRTMFFRCTRLMGAPFLPLFVFDGDERPSEKRGKRISGKNHWLVQGMQSIIKAFGFEWHMAPGEAEAELAYLNCIGVIDGILSDDVDTFLFGARFVIRNPSITLSGNRAHALKNSAGKNDDQHVATYSAEDICTREDIRLTRGGLILIGILRGGDYHQAGLAGCGVTIAHGLAKAGFGESLYQAALTMDRERLETFLIDWRAQVREELRTNSKGFIRRKNPSLAKSLSDDFPDIDIVLSYARPITSETKGRFNPSRFDWEKEPDIGKIAGICELYFEWGVKEVIVKRFRSFLWPAAVLRILRRSALLADRTDRASHVADPRENERKTDPQPSGTPSKMIAKHFASLRLLSPNKDDDISDDEDSNLIVKIHSSRTHASTDNILEYRLEVAPEQLVRFAEEGLRGIRTNVLKNPSDGEGEDELDDDEEGRRAAPVDPASHLRVWMPSCMVDIAEPALVEEFTAKEQAKREKKRAPKGATRKTKPVTSKGTRPQFSSVRTSKNSTVESDTDDKSSGNDVLPMLQPEPRMKITQHGQTVLMIDDDPPEAAAVVKPPKTIPEKPAQLGRSNNIDGVFKAGRATGSRKAPSTRTSKVASLFTDMSHADKAESVQNRSPELRHRTKDGRRNASVPARSQRILSILGDAPKFTRPTTVPASHRVRSLRPFPMSFSDEEDDSASPRLASSPSHRRRRQSTESSELEDRTKKIQKSPPKSHFKDPSSTHTNHTLQSCITQRLRSVSPSPMRMRPHNEARPRAIVNPLRTYPRDIIEISSDSEEESKNDVNQPVPLSRSLSTTLHIPQNQPGPPEVIDLT